MKNSELQWSGKQADLAYRSDPPLPANDIVTLLALGKPARSHATNASGSQSGTAGASHCIGSGIQPGRRAAGKILGSPTFESILV